MVVALATEELSLSQRIFVLAEQGVIDVATREKWSAQERETRGKLDVAKLRLEDTFDDFLSKSYSVAKCRGGQHYWEEYEYDLGYMPIGAAWTESELCPRCGSIRVACVNWVGRDRYKYINPPDFAVKGINPSKSEWKAFYRRIDLIRKVGRAEAQSQVEEPEAKVVILAEYRRAG